MKKLLALIFSLTIIAFGTTAFAEITSDDIINLIIEKQSMDKSFDMSLLGYDDNGNLLVYDNDGVYEPEIHIVPENTFREYQYKKPTAESMENYSGGGLIECFKDFPREEKSYPYKFAQKLDSGEHRYVFIHPELFEVYIGDNFAEDYHIQAAEAAALLNEKGVQEIYDAQLVNVYVGYNYKDENGKLDAECHYDNLWFDTDIGELVVTRVWKPRYIDNNRYSRISTMQEFLDFAIWTVSNTSKTDEKVTTTTVSVDENGDEIIIEKDRGWTILDETRDPSKKLGEEEDAKETTEQTDVETLLNNLKNVIHTAEDTKHTELLEGKIDYGVSMSETDLLCSNIDFSKMYRRYTLLYNETYKKRLTTKGLLGLIHDEPIDTYFGYGINGNKFCRLHFADSDKPSETNPEEYKKFSQCYPVSVGKHSYDIEEYTDALAEIGVSKVYDAYLAAFYVYSRSNDYCYIAYFDTDEGEFVMNIANDRTQISSHSEEVLEYLVLYPIDEFFEKMDIVLDDVQEYNQEKSGTQTNENGDDIVKEPEDSEDEQQREELDDEPAEEPKVEEKPEKTEIDVILFGKYLSFPDQKPIIENGRVLVPFRVIFEALEADVLWDGDTRTVTATKGDITISLTIGENKIIKNGEVIQVDVPAQIQNSRTLVPIRVISESFENTVSWDGTNRIVAIK